MEENDEHAYPEEWAALDQYPDAGSLFLNLPIPAIGLDVSPDEPSNNFRNIIASIYSSSNDPSS